MTATYPSPHTDWSGFIRIQALNRHGAGFRDTHVIGAYFDFWWFELGVFSSLPLPVSCLAHLEQRLQDGVGRWTLANFPSAIRVFLRECIFLPCLSRTSNFDLVSAISVFTHIDEIRETS